MASIVTVADLRAHVGTDALDDTILEEYLRSAVSWVEDYTLLLLAEREVTQEFGVKDALALQHWPVEAVTQIATINPDGSLTDLPASSFRLSISMMPARVILANRRAPTSLQITYLAGSDDVPDVVNQALRLLVAEFFQHREAGAISSDAQRSLRWLLNRYRRRTL